MEWVRWTLFGRPEEEEGLLAAPASWEVERMREWWGLGPMLWEACISLFPTRSPCSSSIVDSLCVGGGGGVQMFMCVNVC